MASRDLTSTFLERRSTANRRRAPGSSSSKVQPFGQSFLAVSPVIRCMARSRNLWLCDLTGKFYLLGISQRKHGGVDDDHLLMEVG